MGSVGLAMPPLLDEGCAFAELLAAGEADFFDAVGDTTASAEVR